MSTIIRVFELLDERTKEWIDHNDPSIVASVIDTAIFPLLRIDAHVAHESIVDSLPSPSPTVFSRSPEADRVLEAAPELERVPEPEPEPEPERVPEPEPEGVSRSAAIDSYVMERYVGVTPRAEISRVPCDLGVVGEEMLNDILTRKFEDVVCTSRRARCGDFVVNGRILVEAKNYTKSVPKNEIDKFHRDVFTRDMKGGILVSIRSPIARHKAFEFDTCINNGNKYFMCYLSFSAEHWSSPHAELLITSAILFLEESVRISSGEIDEGKTDFILRVLEELSDIINTLTDVRSNLYRVRKEILVGIDRISVSLHINLSMMKHKMDHLLTIIREEDPPIERIEVGDMLRHCNASIDLTLFIVERIASLTVSGSLSWRMVIKGRIHRSFPIELPEISLYFLKTKTYIAFPLTRERIVNAMEVMDDCTILDVTKGVAKIQIAEENMTLILHLLMV